MAYPEPPAFLPLNGLYEPSAIVQLPDGRFLAVEDEKSHPFGLFRVGADGSVEASELTPGFLQAFSDFWNLEDLEGVALDPEGFAYAITSHSRDDEGREKKSRDRLVRFRIKGDQPVDRKVCEGLKRAMTAQHPELASAAGVRDVKGGGGLNIEALAVSVDPLRLLVGFRSPLRDGRALIAIVENPAGIFDADEAPRLAPDLVELDLGGCGIRALSYIPVLREFIVISGPVARDPEPFDLWRWNGHPGSAARRVKVPGLRTLSHAEGVSPAIVGGEHKVIVVFDDGNRKERRPAHFLLLGLDQLQAAD